MFCRVSQLREKTIKNICRYINRNVCTILNYHSVIDVPLKFEMWTHIPVSLFAEHMSILSNEVNVVSLESVVNGMVRGKLPKNAVAITFDDGYRNNFTRAYPILKQYNIPATIFLTTGYIGTKFLLWPERLAYLIMTTSLDVIDNELIGKYDLSDNAQKKVAYSKLCKLLKQYNSIRVESIIDLIQKQLNVEYIQDDPLYQEWLPLTRDDIRLMEGEGLIDFGGHTVNHSIFSTHSKEEIIREITNCGWDLESYLINNKWYWAHPNGCEGDFNNSHESMLLSNGFKAIFTSIPKYVYREDSVDRINRIAIGNNVTSSELSDIVGKRYYLGRYSGLKKITAAVYGIFGI